MYMYIGQRKAKKDKFLTFLSFYGLEKTYTKAQNKAFQMWEILSTKIVKYTK